MKTLEILKKMWLVPFLALAMVACETEAETDEELAEFEGWVDNTTANIEQETEESWAETRAEYDRRITDLDRESEEWDEERRTRYENARTRFEDREREAQLRWQQQTVIVTTEPDPQLAVTLIGTSDFSTITRENIKDKYQMFLQNVRNLDDQWTDADWERADVVMDRLDQRREEIDVQTEDGARIIAWKGEYNALKAGDEISGN